MTTSAARTALKAVTQTTGNTTEEPTTSAVASESLQPPRTTNFVAFLGLQRDGKKDNDNLEDRIENKPSRVGEMSHLSVLNSLVTASS